MARIDPSLRTWKRSVRLSQDVFLVIFCHTFHKSLLPIDEILKNKAIEMGSDQNLGDLLYIGDYTTKLYWDYNKAL